MTGLNIRLGRLRQRALLFAVIFVFAAVTQLGFGWYQRRATAHDHLNRWAADVAKELQYTDRWNLTRFRQSFPDATHYYIFSNSGLVIDLEGFRPDLPIRVDLTGQAFGLHTVSVPETNEAWRLLVTRLRGGLVLLGVSPPNDLTNVDSRLRQTASLFGSSLAEAQRVDPNTLDKNIDYAVVGEDGTVVDAAGGIPLKIIVPPSVSLDQLTEVTGKNGAVFGVVSKPIFSSSKQSVGKVLVFDEITPLPWFSSQQWFINLSSSAVLALLGCVVGISYGGGEFRPQEIVRDALEKGESESVEFKESLRWDQWQKDEKSTAALRSVSEGIAIKTIAALLNNSEGGTLLIGIADDKRVVGLQRDYESFGTGSTNYSQDKDRDRFQLHLRSLLASNLGSDISKLYVHVAIVEYERKDICVAHAYPSLKPVFLSDNKSKNFYVRHGASTVALDIETAMTYIDKRWPKTWWRRKK